MLVNCSAIEASAPLAPRAQCVAVLRWHSGDLTVSLIAGIEVQSLVWGGPHPNELNLMPNCLRAFAMAGPLPMNLKKPVPTTSEPPTRTSGSWAKKSNERVLVIADADEMRGYLVDLLSPEGFVVFDQPSAIGATRAIRQNGIRAVVVDVSAPGIRGDKVVSVLRENPRLSGLVVVVVTGEANDSAEGIQGLQSADAILDRSGLEFRLIPMLGRLLRSSNFSPEAAFAVASNKP